MAIVELYIIIVFPFLSIYINLFFSTYTNLSFHTYIKPGWLLNKILNKQKTTK